MDFGLKGKIALIGGASKGIGFGCAQALAAEGAKVILMARDPARLEEARARISKDSIEASALACDLSDCDQIPQLIKNVIDEHGRIDILVANSGGPKPGSFFDLSDLDWMDGYQSVLRSYVTLFREVIPGMRKSGWGRIINITSITVKEPSDTLVLSNAFRSGITALVRTLAREVIRDGITINNILPAAIKTERTQQLMQAKASKTGKSVNEVEAELVGGLPLGRWNTPAELANLVAFLASKQASGISGTNIAIDGGKQKGLL